MEVNLEEQKRYHEFKAEQDKRIKEIYDACNKKLQKVSKNIMHIRKNALNKIMN